MTCFGSSKLVTDTKTDRFNFYIYHGHAKVSSQNVNEFPEKKLYLTLNQTICGVYADVFVKIYFLWPVDKQ